MAAHCTQHALHTIFGFLKSLYKTTKTVKVKAQKKQKTKTIEDQIEERAEESNTKSKRDDSGSGTSTAISRDRGEGREDREGNNESYKHINLPTSNRSSETKNKTS